MAVTNLHKPQKKHADKIARFALDAIKAAQATLIDESDPQRGTIRLRVGFHSGPVVANVVGTKNPRCASRFCWWHWGETRLRRRWAAVTCPPWRYCRSLLWSPSDMCFATPAQTASLATRSTLRRAWRAPARP